MKQEMTKAEPTVDGDAFPMTLFDAAARTGARAKSKTRDGGRGVGAYVCEPTFPEKVFQTTNSWRGAA